MVGWTGMDGRNGRVNSVWISFLLFIQKRITLVSWASLVYADMYVERDCFSLWFGLRLDRWVEDGGAQSELHFLLIDRTSGSFLVVLVRGQFTLSLFLCFHQLLLLLDHFLSFFPSFFFCSVLTNPLSIRHNTIAVIHLISTWFSFILINISTRHLINLILAPFKIRPEQFTLTSQIRGPRVGPNLILQNF